MVPGAGSSPRTAEAIPIAHWFRLASADLASEVHPWSRPTTSLPSSIVAIDDAEAHCNGICRNNAKNPTIYLILLTKLLSFRRLRERKLLQTRRLTIYTGK